MHADYLLICFGNNQRINEKTQFKKGHKKSPDRSRGWW